MSHHETPKTNIIDIAPQLRRRKRTRDVLGVSAALLAAGGTYWLVGPRAHDAPPEPTKTFEDAVTDSAQRPYDPAKDELVIGNIRVKPGHTASYSILTNERVKAFEATNPDEKASIMTSAMTVPSNHSKYAVVERDVDNDGDTDAIAVAIDTE